MPRVKKGAAKRRANKRLFKAVKGYRGPRGTQLRLAKEAAIKAAVNATVDRRRKKRDFRRLWITRISAACAMRDIRYSQFISGCKKAQIELNRKMLSEIAIADPAAFDVIVKQAQAAL
jgi:large subunit ribosomal protein L20